MEETVGLGAVEQGETKKAETRHWERRRKKDTEKERTLPVLLFPPKCCISDLLTFTCQSPFVNRYLNSFIQCIMSKSDSKHLLYLHVVKVKKHHLHQTKSGVGGGDGVDGGLFSHLFTAC